jgi:hypothetical protein
MSPMGAVRTAAEFLRQLGGVVAAAAAEPGGVVAAGAELGGVVARLPRRASAAVLMAAGVVPSEGLRAVDRPSVRMLHVCVCSRRGLVCCSRRRVEQFAGQHQRLS